MMLNSEYCLEFWSRQPIHGAQRSGVQVAHLQKWAPHPLPVTSDCPPFLPVRLKGPSSFLMGHVLSPELEGPLNLIGGEGEGWAASGYHWRSADITYGRCHCVGDIVCDIPFGGQAFS